MLETGPLAGRARDRSPQSGGRGRTALHLLLLGILLLLVTWPRFNLRDPGPLGRLTAGARSYPTGHPIDVEGYVRLTEYFRGDAPADSMIPPFCYRPLVPLLASRLPFRALTSINLINLGCLLLTIVILDSILGGLGHSRKWRTVGCLLFVISFPTFYYGAIGFIDPAALLFVTISVRFALAGSFVGQAGALALGVLAKPTVGAMAAVPLVWGWAHRVPRARRLAAMVFLILLAGLLLLGVRRICPFPPIPDGLYRPNLARLRSNLTRARGWLSLGLTLGVPAAIALFGLTGSRRCRVLASRHSRFLAAGGALWVAAHLCSLPVLLADGRVVWLTYPFLIPLAVETLDQNPKRGVGGR